MFNEYGRERKSSTEIQKYKKKNIIQLIILCILICIFIGVDSASKKIIDSYTPRGGYIEPSIINSKFESYVGETKSATEVRFLIDVIHNNNLIQKNEEDNRMISIVFTGLTDIEPKVYQGKWIEEQSIDDVQEGTELGKWESLKKEEINQ